MDFFARTKAIFTGTGPEFWAEVRKEYGLGDPVRYYLALLAIYAIVALMVISLASLGSSAALEKYAIPSMNIAPAAGIAVLGSLLICVMFLGLFLSAAIMHPFLRLLGGKGDYGHTYRALVYASAPNLIFAPIPVVGSVASIYGFYLQLRGFSELHSITMLRAFGAVLLAGLVFVVFIFAGVFGVMNYLGMDLSQLS